MLFRSANRNKPAVATLLNEAQTKIDFVLLDNSKGMHNFTRAEQLVKEARALAERATTH